MSSAPSAPEIVRDARWLAQALNPETGVARFVEMTPHSYRAASFLDDRMFQGPVTHYAMPLAEVASAMPDSARQDARWIFHIGHVGSTLVSRLLGELDGVLAVREPRILRDVAGIPAEQRGPIIPTVRKLLSRAFSADATALVKATSFVSEIAAELVPAGERALFLTADPRTYIATILAGENNLKELQVWADGRAKRMAERVRGFSGGSAAHLAAAAWACEITALEAAADAMADRHILWANFDRLLGKMESGLGEIAEFFDFLSPPERLREIAHGPLIGRYSKALEYDYSPSLRTQLIAQEMRVSGPEIQDALAMLERSAQESPLLARALART